MNYKKSYFSLALISFFMTAHAKIQKKNEAFTKRINPHVPVKHNNTTLYYEQNKEFPGAVSDAQAIRRKVEEYTRNAVVQIFSHIAEYNFLQPYSTPQQGTVSGSGFFINEQGYLLTNMHVVDQAVGVYIQMPVMGKRLMKVSIIGICPDRDVALLKISKLDLQAIIAELGTLPFLPFANSDDIMRTDLKFV